MIDTIPTLLQIDLQNLFFQARSMGGQRVDLEKIWNAINNRESEFLVDALIYMIRGESFDSSKFEALLKKVGYSLKIKNSIKTVKGGKTFYRQSNQDVAITIDCMARLDSFQKWILMSGDGDFVDLCQYLKKKNKKIEIWSFKETFNPILEPYADKINIITEDFFIKKSNISVFGFNYGDLP